MGRPISGAMRLGTAEAQVPQEISVIQKQQGYMSYLLRLWQIQGNQNPIWCASLENPHTGERLTFTSLPRLFAFLQDQCTGQERGEEPQSRA
jgi:hypothetical protein